MKTKGPAGRRLLRELDALDEIAIIRVAARRFGRRSTAPALAIASSADGDSVALIVPRDFSAGLEAGRSAALACWKIRAIRYRPGVVTGLLQRQVFQDLPRPHADEHDEDAADSTRFAVTRGFNGDLRRAVQNATSTCVFPTRRTPRRMFPEDMLLGSDPDTDEARLGYAASASTRR